MHRCKHTHILHIHAYKSIYIVSIYILLPYIGVYSSMHPYIHTFNSTYYTYIHIFCIHTHIRASIYILLPYIVVYSKMHPYIHTCILHTILTYIHSAYTHKHQHLYKNIHVHQPIFYTHALYSCIYACISIFGIRYTRACILHIHAYTSIYMYMQI